MQVAYFRAWKTVKEARRSAGRLISPICSERSERLPDEM